MVQAEQWLYSLGSSSSFHKRKRGFRMSSLLSGNRKRAFRARDLAEGLWALPSVQLRGPKDRGELIRDVPTSVSVGREPGTASQIGCEWVHLAGSPVSSLLTGSCVSAKPLVSDPKDLTFLLALLMPQARPHSSKALAGKVLILPSEDSFPHPRGLRISPPSTGLCPPAASLRSCTGHWPPSTARTGEGLNPRPGPAPLGGVTGGGPGWPQRSALTVLEFSAAEQGAPFPGFALGSAAGWQLVSAATF